CSERKGTGHNPTWPHASASRARRSTPSRPASTTPACPSHSASPASSAGRSSRSSTPAWRRPPMLLMGERGVDLDELSRIGTPALWPDRVDAACPAPAASGGLLAGVGDAEAAPGVPRGQEAHEGPADGLRLGLADVRPAEEGLLTGVGDEGHLRQT